MAESILNTLNPLSWISNKKLIDDNADEAIKFKVIHTNWYWRCLRRNFHFYKTYFCRVHPKCKEIKAVHNYTDINSITIVDDNNIILE